MKRFQQLFQQSLLPAGVILFALATLWESAGAADPNTVCFLRGMAVGLSGTGLTVSLYRSRASGQK